MQNRSMKMKMKPVRSLSLAVLAVAVSCFLSVGATAGDSPASPAENPDEALSAESMAALPDGVYQAEFDTDSSMFAVNEADNGLGILTVEDGEMTIHIRLMSKKILNLYPGLAEEAREEGAELLEPSIEEVTYPDGYTEEVHAFDVPVPALDEEFDLAIIGTKGKWYDHKVRVTDPEPVDEDALSVPEDPADGDSGTEDAAEEASGPADAAEETSNPESTGSMDDGRYFADVSLEGGSGKAYVSSPCELTVEDGAITARIEFSSPHYDYLIKDGIKYLPVNTEGNSVFEIPVGPLDEPAAIIADTTAMSEPHEIDYNLVFDASSVRAAEEDSAAGSFSLTYAREYSITENEDNSFDLFISGEGFHIDRTYHNIYLAASSAMDLFLAAGAIDSVSMTGTKASDWGIPEIRGMVEDGSIVYAGKYSAPDYEYILSSGCDLAIESTMIYHTPDVREKLEDLGIPVIVERSSYETEPLGRMEWIKLYGLLTGHYEEAAAFFGEKAAEVEALAPEATGRTVAFFYINSQGQPVVRRPGDYVSKMIAMAGGTYFLADSDGEDTALSSMNMQMEAFVEAAEDADILIYNSSIDAELTSLDELIAKDGILSSFKAVREGNVWCTGKNMFQETSGIADMILELNAIIGGEAGDGLKYFHALQ